MQLVRLYHNSPTVDTKISSKFDELYIKLYSVLYDNLLKNIIFIVDKQKNRSKLSNPPSRNNKRNSENPPLVKLKQESEISGNI